MRSQNGTPSIKDSLGRTQNPILINESGLYSLVLCSKLPQAKVFKHWVTAEVLPSIRRHGAYATAPTIEKIIASPEFGIALLKNIQAIERDGEPWFVGKDVAVALGYCKPENALAAHEDQEDKTITLIQGSGSNHKSNTALINESGLYSLVFSSKLPQAKQFKRWAAAEVVPTIHATEPTQRLLRWSASSHNRSLASFIIY